MRAASRRRGRRAWGVLTVGLGVVLGASMARAADYHVAPTGDDAAEGSAERPWRTLQRAAEGAQPGDTVRVRAGDYDGFNLEEKAGTVDRPVTFSAEAGARVVRPGPPPRHPPSVKGSPAWSARTWPHGIHVWGSSYVILEGFEIRGMPDAQRDENQKRLHGGGAGVHVEVSSHVTVRRNRADDNGRWGIFTGFADEVVIEDNECSRSHREHGIYVSNSADRPVIRRNHCWGNAQAGIQINADNNYGDAAYQARGGVADGIVTGALVEGNVLHDNGRAGASGINLDGVQDSVITGNLLYDNHAWGIALYQIDGAEGARRNRVVDNTIVMAEDGRYAIQIADCPTPDPAKGTCAEASAPASAEWARPPGRATGSTGNVVTGNILLNRNPASGSLRIDASSLAKGEAAGEPLQSDGNIIENRLAISAPGGALERMGEDERLTLAAWQARTGQDRRSVRPPGGAPEGGFQGRPREMAAAALLGAGAGAAVTVILFTRRRRRAGVTPPAR